MDPQRKLVLITGHRRENLGQGFIDLCSAIRGLALAHPDWDLIYHVHLNPNVQKPAYNILGSLESTFLLEPKDYASFVWLMNRCDLILTNSGGIQEEGPVLVMRNVTERPEAVDVGAVLLVGTDRERIVSGVEQVLLDTDVYQAMSRVHNPYGDSHAAQRITDVLSSLCG